MGDVGYLPHVLTPSPCWLRVIDPERHAIHHLPQGPPRPEDRCPPLASPLVGDSQDPGPAKRDSIAAISGGANITVNPTALDFGIVPVGETEDEALTVRNIGNAELNVTPSVATTTHFRASPGAFTIAVGGAHRRERAL